MKFSTIESDMMALLDFRRRFDACLAEVGQRGATSIGLDGDDWLTIKGPKTREWLAAAVQALRLTASTFEPAARLLEAIERELNPDRYD